MAETTRDPLDELIADGRVKIKPYTYCTSPVVLDVNLDLLAATITKWATYIYTTHGPLMRLYSGTTADDVTEAIQDDKHQMSIFFMWNCYNRLRRVAEHYSYKARTTRLRPRAPCSDKMEFPTFLTSLVQSIGPLRIDDGPGDMVVIYAPPESTMNNSGRNAPQQPIEGANAPLINILRCLGISLSAVDMTTPTDQTAFWTTCEIEVTDDGLFNVVGTVHKSHYNYEDVVRAAAFVDAVPEKNAFQSVGSWVGPVAADDGGGDQPQQKAFNIVGSTGGTCAAMKKLSFVYLCNILVWFVNH